MIRIDKAKPPVREPTTPAEWTALMLAAIRRAEKLQHSALPGLKKALTEGKSEAYLRRMGVIHIGDIERELPIKP